MADTLIGSDSRNLRTLLRIRSEDKRLTWGDFYT
jgi:hypothetical protein